MNKISEIFKEPSDTMNITIRTAKLDDAKDIANVHATAWQESYKGIIKQSFLDKIDVKKRLQKWQKILSNDKPKNAHYVAEQNQSIIGFIACGPCRTPQDYDCEGEIYAIYVLDHAKKQGIGKKLFQQAAQYLKAENMNSMNVIVLKDNLPACGFYKAMGGTLHKNNISVEIDGQSYLECIYIYKNLKDKKYD